MKRPSKAQTAQAVSKWNATHPIGTKVTVFRTTRRDAIKVETTTRSEAFVSDADIAVIFLEGVSGYWALECVVPRPVEASA